MVFGKRKAEKNPDGTFNVVLNGKSLKSVPYAGDFDDQEEMRKYAEFLKKEGFENAGPWIGRIKGAPTNKLEIYLSGKIVGLCVV